MWIITDANITDTFIIPIFSEKMYIGSRYIYYKI